MSLYLACLGLDAGKDFLATVVRPEGLLWIGLGFALTVVPVVIVGLIALRLKKFDFGTICGILCGSMANPMALGYANDTVKGETSNISYASVYPLGIVCQGYHRTDIGHVLRLIGECKRHDYQFVTPDYRLFCVPSHHY